MGERTKAKFINFVLVAIYLFGVALIGWLSIKSGHTRTVGTWIDMQNKMVGYTLQDCMAVAKGRRERGEFPFPHNAYSLKLRRNAIRRANRAAKKLQGMSGFEREAKNRNAAALRTV